MSRRLALAAATLALAACAPEQSSVAPVYLDNSLDARANTVVESASHAVVRNTDNDGAGSLRAAIARANTSSAVRVIQFVEGLGTIRLSSPIEYTGTQPLEINGVDAVIDAAGVGANGDGIRVTAGASLTVTQLTVQNSPQEGIDISVPATATGVVHLVLDGVTIRGNKGHGVLLNDQVTPDVGEGEPDPRGSDASVHVQLRRTRFLDNGYSVSDRDGLRVNEGGNGYLQLVADDVWANDNAADGIELDERGNGNVFVQVTNTQILRNGKLDPNDLDDGFDIDETNDGDIVGFLRNVNASDNYEEGLDFNENHAGDLRVDLYSVVANNNGEEGIDYEEDDDFAGGGELVSAMVDITANGNGKNGGDGGLKIREKGVGSLSVDLTRVRADNNKVTGVDIRETEAGNLLARLETVFASTNAGRGVRVRQESTGFGQVSSLNVFGTGNTNPLIETSGVN
ncbi:MAG: hypothetical protein IBJ03_09115 [Gemmatimonadaceae bacterium]|nr:hypothetical protein [Gemmatimonadaceae bacterium]